MEHNELLTISRRISRNKVEASDNSNRFKVVSANQEYKVGDIILVTSGVVVQKVGSVSVSTFEV